MEASTATTKRPSKRLRNFTSAVLMLAVLLVVARLLLPDAVGEQVRRSFQQILSEHYRGKIVTIRSGRYDPQLGVVLRGIEIRDADLPQSHLPMLTIEQMVVQTKLQPTAITQNRQLVSVEKIIVDGTTLNFWQADDLSWPVATLWPPPQFGPACPVIAASRVRVNLCRDSRTLQQDIDLGLMQFVLHQSNQPASSTEATEHPLPTSRQITATLSGGLAQEVQIQAILSADKRHLVQGRATNLRITPALLASLPLPWRSKFDQIANLNANSDVVFTVKGDTENHWQDWGCRLNVHSGSVSPSNMPIRVDQFRGHIVARPSGVQIQSAHLTVNGAHLQGSGTIAGLSWPCPLALKLTAQDFQLDSSLAKVLPEEALKIGDRIRPEGKVDLQAEIAFDGRDWDVAANVHLNAIALNLDVFPYPVERVSGVVSYRNQVARADNLTGQVGNAKVACSFAISPQKSGKEFWVVAKADRPIEIDEALIAALTPRGKPQTKLESFVRSLSPGGSVMLHSSRFLRNSQGTIDKQLDLEVLDGNLRYAKFPYPLYEVRGRIAVDPDGFHLSHFQAQNQGGARIECEGNFKNNPDPDGGQLALHFRSFSVPLDDALRNALPEPSRQTWDTLAPAGVLEKLEVQLTHRSGDPEPKLAILAQQWGNPGVARREVSVTPVALPYRLDITRGVVRSNGDTIIISDVDGYHGSSRVAAEGFCQRRSDGRWQLDLNLLTGSRLRPDNELLNALPEDIRGGFTKLQLREPVALRGNTQLLLPNPQFPTPEFRWDVVLQLEGNRIADTGPVHNIRGEIAVQGHAQGGQANATGEVRIDSLHVYDLQATSIQGPFLIRDNRLYLGTDGKNQPGDANPIRARVFDGDATLHGNVLLSSGQFNVRGSLQQGNVVALMADLQQPQAGLTGEISGDVALQGNLGASNLLRGTGKASLSKANLYQLPLIVQLFNQLRLTPAENVAFTDGSSDFSIDGDQLTLSELQLWGPLVAIHGGGTVNRRHEINLSFNTRVSPQNAWSQLVRPLRSQQYTLWTINVSGSLAEPRIERRALEAVGESLERLFPGIERDPATIPPPNYTPPQSLRAATRRLLGADPP